MDAVSGVAKPCPAATRCGFHPGGAYTRSPVLHHGDRFLGSQRSSMCRMLYCVRPRKLSLAASAKKTCNEILARSKSGQQVKEDCIERSESSPEDGLNLATGSLAAAAAASSLLLFSPAALALASPTMSYFSTEMLSEGFISAFLLILFSEIGDKTFFIAVLLSLQNPRTAIFAGTFGALTIMTVISVVIGQSLHQIDGLIPEDVAQFPLDDIFAAALLIVFGIQTLLAAKDADDNALEEQNEAQEVVAGLSAGAANGVILTTFGLVFAAEWGDKSFLATAALSAASSPAGVCFGAISGHAVATVIAVLGGSFLSKYISERAVQYIGGSLFLVFAAITLVELYTKVQA